MMRLLVVSAFLVAWATAAWAAPAGHYFTGAVVSPRGASTTLAEQARQHALVVVVLKGIWCPVCVGQLAELSALRQRLDALGAYVVGLSTADAETNRVTAKRLALSYPILSDASHGLIGSLGLWRPRWGHPLPAIVVFDRCGNERARFEGRAPGDRPEGALLRLLKLLAAETDCGLPNA